jgi:hypothetical protein
MKLHLAILFAIISSAFADQSMDKNIANTTREYLKLVKDALQSASHSNTVIDINNKTQLDAIKSYSEIIYSNFEPIAFKTIRNAGYNTDGNYPKGSKENAEKLRIELENKLQQAINPAPGLRKRKIPFPKPNLGGALGSLDNLMAAMKGAGNAAKAGEDLSALKGIKNADNAGAAAKGVDNVPPPAGRPKEPEGRGTQDAEVPPNGQNQPPPADQNPPVGASDDVIGAAAAKQTLGKKITENLYLWVKNTILATGFVVLLVFMMSPSPDTSTPDALGMQPGTEGMQPGTEGMQPGTEGMQPGTEGMQPGTEGLDPSYDDLSFIGGPYHYPGTEGMQPGTEGLDPSYYDPLSDLDWGYDSYEDPGASNSDQLWPENDNLYGGYGNYEDLGASDSDQLWPENDNQYGGSDNYQFSENGGSSGLESPALDPSLDTSNIDQNVSPQDGIQVDSTTGSNPTTGTDYSSMYPDIIDDVNNYTWTFDPVAMKYFRFDENSEKVYYE